MRSKSLWLLGVPAAVLTTVLLGAGRSAATTATPSPTATPTFDLCPLDLVLTPGDVAAGTQVEVAGRCYWLHSGRAGQVYFDSALVGGVRGDTSGDLTTTFRVPLRTTAGEHVVRIPIAVNGGTALRGSVHVAGRPEGCPGDCNDDDTVRLDELVRAIDIFLGEKPTESCAVDRNQDGKVTIDEAMATVRSALNGCPALVTTASLAATYDVTATFDSIGARTGMGSVHDPAAGMLGIDIEFDPLSSIHLSGALTSDGSVIPEGYRIEGGDIASFARGTAYSVLRPGIERIVGDLDIDPGIGRAADRVTFVMERPEHGTSPRTKTYRLFLEHLVLYRGGSPYDSSLGLSVDVPENGFGTCGGGDHYDQANRPLPNPAPGLCQVTPQGRFNYTTRYASDGDPYPPVIYFFGMFSATGSASGEFYIGGFPTVIEQGTWTADDPD